MRVAGSLAGDLRVRARRTGDSVCLRASLRGWARPRSVTRSSRFSATPGWAADAASSSRSFALRSPVSSVARWTSSKDACGDARSRILPASRRRARSSAERTSRPLPSCVRSPTRSRRRARCSDDGAKRVGSRDAPGRRRRTRRRARVPRGRAHARRARGRSRNSTSAVSAHEDLIAALERTMVGRVPLPRPAESPFWTTAVRGRGRSTSCSCSGSRKGAFLAATGRRRSSTTICGASSEAASNGRTRVARDRYLFYTACTRPTQRLVLVREAASDEGVPREPSPFWDDVRALFAPPDVARVNAPPAAVQPDLAARLGAERARAPARARAPDRRGRRGRRRARRGERLVAAPRARPAGLRPSDEALEPDRARDDGEQDRVLRDGARAVRRLLVGLAGGAGDRPEDDRRRARPDAQGTGRAHGTEPVLRCAAAGARLGAGDARQPRGGARSRSNLPGRRARDRRAARPAPTSSARSSGRR